MRATALIGIVSFGLLIALSANAQTEKETEKSKSKASTKSSTAKKKIDSKIERGAKLFGTHCASCHALGGNTITPNKPVKGSPVLATLATFKSYLNEPIGNMPHYEHLITDEKLLSDLRAYARSLDQPKTPTSDQTNSKEKQKKSL